MPSLTIATAAHKGGAGKTTLTASVAGALVEGGRRVLAVDCDPQGALGAVLGVDGTEGPTLYEVLTGRAAAADAVVASSVEGLDLIASDRHLAGADLELPRRAGWQRALRERLTGLEGYDVVLLDTAPGLGVLPFVALVAARAVLVACPPDFLALRALPQLLATVDDAVKIAGALPVVGIVPTMTEHRTRHEAEVLDELRRGYRRLLLSELPRRVAFRDAGVAGEPVTAWSPRSDAADAARRLAKEVLRHAEAKS